MYAMTHTSTHAHQRNSHLAQVVYLCFYTLLCTDVAHQDHLCMVYTCATQRPLDLSCMNMHSAVAQDNDIRVNRPALGGTVPISTAMSRRPALLTPCPAFIDHPVLGGTSCFPGVKFLAIPLYRAIVLLSIPFFIHD